MADITFVHSDKQGLFTFEVDTFPYVYKLAPERIQTAYNLLSLSEKKCYSFCKKQGIRLVDAEDDIWNTDPNKPFERWRIGEKVIAYIGINPDTNGKAIVFEALGEDKKLVVRIKLNLGSEIDKLKWIVKERL